eukprot:1841799-Amphidinium_carterae.1
MVSRSNTGTCWFALPWGCRRVHAKSPISDYEAIAVVTTIHGAFSDVFGNVGSQYQRMSGRLHKAFTAIILLGFVVAVLLLPVIPSFMSSDVVLLTGRAKPQKGL